MFLCSGTERAPGRRRHGSPPFPNASQGPYRPLSFTFIILGPRRRPVFSWMCGEGSLRYYVLQIHDKEVNLLQNSVKSQKLLFSPFFTFLTFVIPMKGPRSSVPAHGSAGRAFTG